MCHQFADIARLGDSFVEQLCADPILVQEFNAIPLLSTALDDHSRFSEGALILDQTQPVELFEPVSLHHLEALFGHDRERAVFDGLVQRQLPRDHLF